MVSCIFSYDIRSKTEINAEISFRKSTWIHKIKMKKKVTWPKQGQFTPGAMIIQKHHCRQSGLANHIVLGRVLRVNALCFTRVWTQHLRQPVNLGVTRETAGQREDYVSLENRQNILRLPVDCVSLNNTRRFQKDPVSLENGRKVQRMKCVSLERLPQQQWSVFHWRSQHSFRD